MPNLVSLLCYRYNSVTSLFAFLLLYLAQFDTFRVSYRVYFAIRYFLTLRFWALLSIYTSCFLSLSVFHSLSPSVRCQRDMWMSTHHEASRRNLSISLL